MGRYIGIPILLFGAILNTTVMAAFRIGQGAPDVVFLLVIAWALLSDLRAGLLWAVIGGVMQDLLSVAPLGTSALGLVLVVFGAELLFGQVHRNNVLIPPVVALVGTAIYHAGVLVVLRSQGYAVPLGQGLIYVTLPTMVYNLILILPVYRVVGWLYWSMQPRRVRLE